MTNELKLLGTWVSPFSHRIKLALKLKGLQFEYIEEDLSNKSQLLLQSNPVHKKIPVLIHNGKPIPESLIILEYIDETWADQSPLLPKDPYDRAIARFWAKFIDEKVLPAGLKAYRGKDKEQEDAIEEFTQQLKFLEGELKGKGKDYFGGGSCFGFADIAAFYILHFLEVMQEAKEAELMTQEKFPLLFKWMEKLQANEVVAELLPPREKLLAFIRVRFAAAEEAASKTKAA